ncbi:MAG: hypothetical protein N3E36_07385 [Sulfolobales archaeon]|nr:hypothetical protein [Sulfolobales archaeon]
MMLLKIKPLEELVLSRTPIATHDVFGVHYVRGTPLPTTIIGLIGSLLNLTYSGNEITGLGELVIKLRDKFSCKEPIIKGPLIYFDELRNEPYIQVGDSLVPINRIKWIDAVGKKLFYINAIDHKYIVKCEEGHRIGIKLRRGYEDSVDKAVSPGFMYRYSTVRYSTIDGEVLTPTITYALNCNTSEVREIARVGGESRVAIVEIIKSEEVIGIDKLVAPLDADEDYYIALSPIPLLPKRAALHTLLLSDDVVESGVVSEVIGLPPLIRSDNDVERIKEMEIQAKRRIERLNLGFSEVVKRRRPQILALPQGTVIKSRRVNYSDVSELLRLLWNIGFSSLLKIS